MALWSALIGCEMGILVFDLGLPARFMPFLSQDDDPFNKTSILSAAQQTKFAIVVFLTNLLDEPRPVYTYTDVCKRQEMAIER